MKMKALLVLLSLVVGTQASEAQTKCDRKDYFPCVGDIVYAENHKSEVIGLNRQSRNPISIRVIEQTESYAPVGTVWHEPLALITIGYPGLCANDLGSAESQTGPIVGINILTKRVTLKVERGILRGKFVTWPISMVSSQGCLDPYRW